LRTTILLTALVFASATPALADTFNAFEGNIHVGSPQNGGTNVTGKGRQTFGGNYDMTLGLDFSVLATDPGVTGILITRLGIWDDNGDGLLSPHILMVFDADTQALLASIATQPGGGLLQGGYRYFDLPVALDLAVGTNFIVAAYSGPGNKDSNGNSGKVTQSFEPTPTFIDGGGLIENNGDARFGYSSNENGVFFGGPLFPSSIDTGPENRYHAASFTYTPNPEPGTMVLLGGVALGAGIVRRRRQKRLAARNAA
jgi:hypothetical protein